jgi:hypothetical protein
MTLQPANKPASRHIDIRIHFCRHHVELGDVSTTFTPTPDMVAEVADFMTKQTQRLTHERHCQRVFCNQLAPIPLELIVRVLVWYIYNHPSVFFCLIFSFFSFLLLSKPWSSEGG